MKFPLQYACLKQKDFRHQDYQLIPIRFEDRHEIMRWRNSQIDFLRQKKPLSDDEQEKYFKEIVAPLFDEQEPKQLLFSFLQNEKLIGYGGLVHIHWKNRNSEISFLLSNDHDNEKQYLELFDIFLKLIQNVASELKLHKIFTYGHAIYPYKFEPLIRNLYKNEAVLKQHVCIQKKLYDVKIYSKMLRP